MTLNQANITQEVFMFNLKKIFRYLGKRVFLWLINLHSVCPYPYELQIRLCWSNDNSAY